MATHLSSRWRRLPMILSFCGGGFSLWTDVSFADLKTQFIGEILGKVAHLPVLLGSPQQTHVGQNHTVGKSDLIYLTLQSEW